MRDPTRGGLAATLVEIASRQRLGIDVDERAIPVRDAVRGACEILGLDPLLVANEGKLVAFVPAADAERARWRRCAPTRSGAMPRASAASPPSTVGRSPSPPPSGASGCSSFPSPKCYRESANLPARCQTTKTRSGAPARF